MPITFPVSKCYERIDEDSAAQGDAFERGYEYALVPMTLREIVRELEPFSQLSGYPIRSDAECDGVWASTTDPEMDRDFWESGIETYYSLHIDAPGRQLRRIYRLAKLLK